MSVIYEVNLEVHPDIAAEFADWLPGHIEEVLGLPGFIDAEMAREDNEDKETDNWSVRYHLIDREALENYLDEHAERMRAQGTEKFGGKISAGRRILTNPRRLPRK